MSRDGRLWFAATVVGLIVLAALVIDVFRDGLSRLDWQFLTSFPSRRPENAGIYSALRVTGKPMSARQCASSIDAGSGTCRSKRP